MSLKMTAEVIGRRNVIKALKRFGKHLDEQVFNFMKREGAQMEMEIKNSMSTAGRLKAEGPRGGKLRIHSKPGEPPYVQTGRLRASIGYMIGQDWKHVAPGFFKVMRYFDIGSIRKAKGGEVKYANKVEVELKRPYLMPVVKRHLDKWKRLFKGIVNTTIKRTIR